MVYIVQVLVEHPTHALDTTFDYLANTEIASGVRVTIAFGYQRIIGYVTGCRYSNSTKEELEAAAGFKYRYISEVIDERPLLNQELQELSLTLAKLTLSPRISCLQAMLPPQLKPSTNKSVGIKYQKVIKVINEDATLKTVKQQEAYQYLKTHPDTPLKAFPYSRGLLDKLIEQRVTVIIEQELYRDPYLDDQKEEHEFSLTVDQQKVVNGIMSKIDTYHTALIHGVTGSGKTEVYLHLSKYVIRNNKTVLMLVPEISLTPMMVNAFKHKFGKEVAILHSKLSAGERYDEYRRILNSEVKIVVGARSAVFAPLADEIRNKNYSLFSKAMKEQIQTCLDHDEQVILLLNKRGYATYVRCLDCGEVIKCPHCDVTLTYHKADHKLRCHYCEHQIEMPRLCPHCSSERLKLVGTGTQKVEEQLETIFDGAKVIRYDVDTTKQKDGHQKLLDKFARKEGNILLGTQMIAKGLDFENVTFVGVLNADISLNIPDFRANERTFQLLEQVSGRSGRGQKEGTVMIQTYNPEHFVLQCVKNHDYLRFYQEEMKTRKLAAYPPYVHLVSILIQGKDEEVVNQSAVQIKEYLQKQLDKMAILGPANSLIYRMQDIYRKRIMIKFTNSKQLYPVLEKMSDFYNKKGNKVHVVCDFNPYNQI